MKTINQLMILGWALCSVLLSVAYAHNNQPLKLYVGAVELYKIANVERVVVGNGGVLSAKVLDEKNVILIGESEGLSDIQLWQKDGTVRKLSVVVTKENAQTTVGTMKRMLAEFPSIEVTESDGVIVIHGEADASQRETLEKVLDGKDNILPLIKYVKYGKSIEPMVKMEVKIVEFNKSTLNNIGVQWENVMSGPAFGAAKAFTANPIFSVSSPGQYANSIGGAVSDAIGVLDTRGWSYFGIVTGIGSQIQLLAEKGDARMLAEPNLTTRSGEAASFLAGGEIPIRTVSGVGSVDIQYKEYGIRLNIEPVVDADNNIVSRVMAEVSAVDPSIQLEGSAPGFLTRRTESVINVKNKQTMVISGLVNSEMSKVVNKFPFLGDIPILGELFKSRNFREEKTELVIFVTPTVVYPGEESHEKSLSRARELVDDAAKLEAFYILD
ncbi:type II and III secretion system protein family protein [Shewanella sp. FJAT-52076]|uniref:type II and III secretion system protein family protein n=1 Tax=Shewanella sp. FJAT-52076 TaxID=2864202 RepID=UPI001C65D635|nr:pilus assembly protein N-terminal domain-containing protein [Shewanella sp. FJAT-52076]QYJ76079.1 pilus assembly protein N-terminal domain-containing protein [Shewanella sp. FJAT-52076]